MPAGDRTLAEISTLKASVRSRAFTLVWVLRAFAGLPAVVTEGRRTLHRQRALFAQGRTAPGKIVTQTLESRHLSGEAFDIGFLGVAPDDADRAGWFHVAGQVGELLGLRWGGRFRNLRDLGHFEA